MFVRQHLQKTEWKPLAQIIKVYIIHSCIIKESIGIDSAMLYGLNYRNVIEYLIFIYNQQRRNVQPEVK